MIDCLGRIRRPQVLRLSGLSALLAILASPGRRFLRLDDVARRRLRGRRGVFAGRSQLLLEALVFSAEPLILLMESLVFLACVVLFQRNDALHRCEEILRQRGHTRRQAVGFALATRFPQLHGAESSVYRAAKARSNGRCSAHNSAKISAVLGKSDLVVQDHSRRPALSGSGRAR